MLRKDIERLSGTTSRIDRDIIEFRDFMKEVRADLKSLGRVYSREKCNNEELANLRRELHELRQQMNQNGGISSHESITVVAEDVKKVAQKAEEVDDLKTELKVMKAQIKSLEATQRSMIAANSSNTIPRRTRLSSLEKRKYEDHNDDYIIHEVRRTDEADSKRRKVSVALSPHGSPNADAESRRVQYSPSYQQSILLGASLSHDSSPSQSSRRDKIGNLIQNDVSIARDPELSNIGASTDSQARATASSNVVIEFGSPMLPPLIMPLRNGTILGADSRNELLDVSHIEAATGLKRDVHGRWLTPSRNFDRHHVISGQANATGPNAVFANGLVGNATIAEQERENKHTLLPKKDQSKTKSNTTIKTETCDGTWDERP